jgi:hypothetical protein
MQPHRYLRLVALLTALMLAPVVFVNVVVDPFGIFRRWHLPHVPRDPVFWSRVSAGERVTEKCQVVLMGSSRTMHGYGYDVPDWGGKTVCNAAVGGTSVWEQVEIFDRVRSLRRPKFAVFFADFHIFNPARGSNGDFAQSRFNDDRSLLTYYLWALTSLDAAKASAEVMGHPLGKPSARIPRTQLAGNRLEIYRFLENPHLYTGWTGDDETMNAYMDMVQSALRDGMRAVVVIPPIHALLMEAEARTGRTEAEHAWKRRLTLEVAERFGDRVQLWDFSTYHKFATDPMPVGADSPSSPWWVDVSHQSGRLGWLVMARLIFEEDPELVRSSGNPDVETWDARFGVRLTPQTVEGVLAQVDADRQAWRLAQPDQVAWLEAWAGELDALGEGKRPSAFALMEEDPDELPPAAEIEARIEAAR